MQDSHTQTFNSGAINLDDGATTYDITVAVNYSIEGKAYSKATVSNGATPTSQGDSTAFSTVAVNYGCVLLWCLNAAGTVGLFQSDVVALNSGGTDFADGKAPNFPVVDLSTWCPFAYSVILNGPTGSTFTVGSSNWNATGIVETSVNINRYPKRPQQS